MIRIFAFVLPLFVLLLQECDTAQSTATATSNDSLTLRTSYIRDSAATVDTLEIVFYFPENAQASLTSTRPLKTDSQIIFCCAAAFTLLDDGQIDGLFVENGKTIRRKVNHSLGGGIVIPPARLKAQVQIFGTDMGKNLDSAFVDSLERSGCSFFQQIQMVRDGQALVFRKDVSKFQRRAICTFEGKTVVIETKWPCTLQKFADILKKLNIPNALYVDMGSWDEGWYRTQSNSIVTIGILRNSTKRQSNWFVFKGDVY